MISVQVKEPKHLNNPKNAFVVKCVAVVGDGDEYYNFSLAPVYKVDGYENVIAELVELLDHMENFHWVDDKEYSSLENFTKWFGSVAGQDEGIDENVFIYNGFIAILDQYSISYFDHDGLEYSVDILRDGV